MTIRAGAKIDAQDFDVPDVVTAFGNGTNTIVSAAFAVMPTTTCTANLTNPHPTASLLTLVTYGAWMNCVAANDVRMSLDISGALTIAAGIGGGAAVGWGEIPIVSGAVGSLQLQATITVALPPGTTTFKTFGLRTGAGTVQINYPTIRVVPLAYIF
jgi:hypothetical protein